MKKTVLVLVGLAVAASTVYAVVLRATTEPATESIIVTGPAASAPLFSRVQPRTWGRLIMLDEPSASPGFTMVIRTPPVVIVATPQTETAETEDEIAPVHRQVVRPVVESASDTSGVMARFKAPPPARSNLPEAPDRDAISRVMGAVRTEIQECYDRGMVPGQVDLVLTVEGETGNVRRASVSATSSTATCIQRVARTLRFPRFSKETITIRYPYSFR